MNGALSAAPGRRWSRRYRATGVWLCVASLVQLLALAHSAAAQTNLQVPVQFDFLDPGARSLAMGSAFTPLADDATAAVTNPAGLVQMLKPEISFELRGRWLETPYLQGGRLSGTVTNRGIDTVAGPIYGQTLDASVFPSFISVVYPLRRASFAVYGRQLVNIDQEFERVGVLGLFTTPDGVRQDAREPAQRVSRIVKIATGGAALGYRFSDRLSAGLAFSVGHLTFDEISTRYATAGIDLISLDPVHPSVYGAPDFSRLASGGFSSRREVLSPQVIGYEWGAALNGGVLLTVRPGVRIAGAFQRGPTFDFHLKLPDETTTAGRFATPDTYTVGAVSQPTDVLTLVAEYRRVNYSALRRGFVDVIVGPGGEADRFVIHDANEVHAGVEYVFGQIKMMPAARFGMWYDPAHDVRFEGSTTMNPFFNELFLAALRGGDNLVHITGGTGLSISRRLEVNLAADVTRRNRLFSASTVVRF